MLHGDFQLQKVLPKINVARKLNVKKSCNEEVLKVLQRGHAAAAPDLVVVL